MNEEMQTISRKTSITRSASLASAESSAETATISATVTSCEAAMNASNTDALIALYAEDGVLMSPYSHSVVGKAAVRDAYDAGSKVFALRVRFNIAEVVQMARRHLFESCITFSIGS